MAFHFVGYSYNVGLLKRGLSHIFCLTSVRRAVSNFVFEARDHFFRLRTEQSSLVCLRTGFLYVIYVEAWRIAR